MRAPRRGTAGAAAARSRCREVSRGAGSGTREKARQWRRLSESRPPSTAERGEGRARTHGLSLSSSRSASSAAMVLARREASRGVPPSAPPRAGNRRRKPKTNLTPTLARRGCASQVSFSGTGSSRHSASRVPAPRWRPHPPPSARGAKRCAPASVFVVSVPVRTPPALRATAPFARVATQFFPRARGLDRAPRAPRASRV